MGSVVGNIVGGNVVGGNVVDVSVVGGSVVGNVVGRVVGRVVGGRVVSPCPENIFQLNNPYFYSYHEYTKLHFNCEGFFLKISPHLSYKQDNLKIAQMLTLL